jgi:3-oxoacyl-[acyl-carrier protein] reductase
MKVNLSGKTAIVTGGARDIGRAVVLKLAESGAAVAINYNASAAKAEALAKEITGRGGRAIAVQADVTKTADARRLVSETQRAFGNELHILVNNAGGIVARKKVDEMDEAFWDSVMALNVRSVFLMTQAVVPHMPDGCAIVNLSSLAARDGGGGGSTAYAAAKGAVLTFTRGLAKELGGRRIRVNAVSPGMINTAFHDQFTKPEIRATVASRSAAGREGRPDEIADAVLFLASDASSYITGESMEINGGSYFI